MRKTGFLPLIIVLAFFLASCDFFDLFEDDLAYLNDGEFYARNVKTGKYYKVKAEILANGDNCVVWAENGSGVTQAKAKEIAAEYDNIIRPKITGAFGKKNFYTDQQGREYKEGSTNFFFADILDYANELAGGRDNKLTILLLDIKDGFDAVRNPAFVAGYFYGGNFFTKGKISGSDYYSNGRDMIYIDTYPGLRDEVIHETYSTLAHELQHLINFVTTVLVNRTGSTSPPRLTAMDTWIDEGLSAWAEYLYQEDNPPDRCKTFIEDEAGTIARGNNFFVWDNHEDEPMAILDDYATVYLFFRWLSLQAAAQNPQNNIFYKIITSPNFNYNAVTDVAKEINTEWGNWQNLLGTWLAANHNPKNTNYGYKGDDYLRENIKVNPVAGTSSIPLYPGEGVYSVLNNSFTPTGQWGNNIRYAGLSSANTSTVSISGGSGPYNGNILLTFNASTDKAGKTENGRLTGVSVSSVLPRSLTGETKTVEFKGPYVIDARDVLGRNRDKDPFPLPGRMGLSGR
jgi:hypothetical protein